MKEIVAAGVIIRAVSEDIFMGSSCPRHLLMLGLKRFIW